MPNVVLSVTDGSGGIDVNIGASHVNILGDLKYTDVIIGASTVTLKATSLFLRLRVQWLGGTTTPTLLSAYPASDWGTETGPSTGIYTPTPNPDVIRMFHAGTGNGYWVIQWRPSPTSVSSDVSVHEITGASVASIQYESFSWVNAPAYSSYTIRTRDSFGIGVNPGSGQRCSIVIPA